MSTNEKTMNGGPGITGFFNSVVGFSYASFLYGLRFLFTNPMDMPERARVSLDRVSDALNRSMPQKPEAATAQEVRADSLNDAVRGSTQTPAADEKDAEILSGRKR